MCGVAPRPSALLRLLEKRSRYGLVRPHGPVATLPAVIYDRIEISRLLLGSYTRDTESIPKPITFSASLALICG